MSTAPDPSSLAGADADADDISSTAMDTNTHSAAAPRDLFTLLTNALTHYPVVKLLATHLHDADLVNLMLTSRAINHTIAPSRAAIKKFTCGGVNRWRFGCWCCGTQICVYCCYDVFLPQISSQGTHWPTEEDKLHNDKSIRNPACHYEFSDARRCCLGCWKTKPAWWIKEKFQERASRDGIFLQMTAKKGEACI
ncbi:hypothetical protein BGX38DRAFT_1138751 [Terfezia claveryi]|nr:hypothetical protein BGX38DRAFT_1138751 [Terfezia claveryi]